MVIGLFEKELQLDKLIALPPPPITDDASAAAAAAAGKSLKEFRKEITEKKAAALAPIRDKQTEITALFAPVEKKIDEAIKKLTIALQTYNAEQRRIATETQRALDKERADALLAGAAPAAAVKAIVAAPHKTVTTRRMKRLKILDAAKIPREFLQPDERKIFDALKAGKNVPGAVIEEYESAYI